MADSQIVFVEEGEIVGGALGKRLTQTLVGQALWRALRDRRLGGSPLRIEESRTVPTLTPNG